MIKALRILLVLLLGGGVLLVILVELRDGTAAIKNAPYYSRDSHPLVYWSIIILHMAILLMVVGYFWRCLIRRD